MEPHEQPLGNVQTRRAAEMQKTFQHRTGQDGAGGVPSSAAVIVTGPRLSSLSQRPTSTMRTKSLMRLGFAGGSGRFQVGVEFCPGFRIDALQFGKWPVDQWMLLEQGGDSLGIAADDDLHGRDDR